MFSEFWVWLRMGLSHIADLQGYDHILFIVALVAVYTARQWRTLLWLVTAFTLGHSITLVLATMGVVNVNPSLVEVWIPLTIILTCIFNIVAPDQEEQRIRPTYWQKYVIALGFGLVHGLGFSNFLREILGEEESLLLPLFSFNVGLEVGQLLIVAIALTISTLVLRHTKLKPREWVIFVSAGALGLACWVFYTRASEMW